MKSKIQEFNYEIGTLKFSVKCFGMDGEIDKDRRHTIGYGSENVR